LIAAAYLLANSGCMTGPVTEPMHFRSTAYESDYNSAERNSRNNNAPTKECLVYIKKIEDHRSSKHSFGSLRHFQKFAESVPQWTKEGLQSLNNSDYRIEFNDIEELNSDVPVTMHVKIHKAYVLHQSSSKSANLVVSVVYSSKKRAANSKLYRGRYTAINWTGNAGEIESAMNVALLKVLEKIETDISQYCSG
jgi:hypothetical protein